MFLKALTRSVGKMCVKNKYFVKSEITYAEVECKIVQNNNNKTNNTKKKKEQQGNKHR